MRHRWALAAAIVLIGVIIAGTLWRARAPESASRVDGISEETGSAAQDGAEVRSRPGARPSLELPQERAARIAKIREAQETKAAAVVAAGKSKLESAFASEKPNPAWASAKERELEGFVVNPQMESINALPSRFDVECRSATCRIEADFSSVTALDDWVTLFLTNNRGALPRASMTRVPQPDGSVKLVLTGATN